ncbi:RidA family protein [Streptomyces sp. NPDC059063]|uniref:RidA family protein n=1 Tax=unclassified Streptomyces TaxID=2593676 RepID=UPI0036840155
MNRLTHIHAPDGVAPATAYTHVVTGTGRLVAVSGQLALDEEGKLVGEGDAAAQAMRVFENLRRCLAAAGATFDDVIKLTYFVTDMAHMPAVRIARDAYLDPARLPASSAMQVAGLIDPAFLMEIEALAVVPEEGATGPTGPVVGA